MCCSETNQMQQLEEVIEKYNKLVETIQKKNN